MCTAVSLCTAQTTERTKGDVFRVLLVLCVLLLLYVYREKYSVYCYNSLC